jgi:hypothetical protein
MKEMFRPKINNNIKVGKRDPLYQTMKNDAGHLTSMDNLNGH